MKLTSSYDPEIVEEKWYRIWEEGGYFHAHEDDGKEPYCIVIPPPNVTGNLHIGHALNNTLQDILIRWQRMLGKSALWMPGMDHAGIATQNVVERILSEKGMSKEGLGREQFEKRVWEWKEQSGGRIQKQLRRLGCSCDWERERFTLDKGLSRAVNTVFAALYKKGLIYQGYRIINWCPRCGTALSDIETEYREVEGHLWYIRYPVAGSRDYIVVATTRPETMLGDTGVAANPEDERYAGLVGRRVVLPLMNREIPVFADDFVDKDFGTGLVKVTPAHDPNDFDMGKRHGLEEINILDKKGFINENGGRYKGLPRFEARTKVVEDLEKQGLLDKIEKHIHSVGHCYRCHTIIEPYLSKQWFVKIKPLAEPAIRAVEDGRIRFVPKSWEKTYFDWMRNIRDWCISRQLWWGHRIPAYHCGNCGHITVSVEDPSACEECGSHNIRQDEDVLDTWFSSGLWPFSTLGWPDATPALKKYYPTSVLVTAFDIIFFWVARMIMLGLKFMDDVPFREVYIHALIRDEQGAKMSKSRGNVVDPLVMMDQYGTDALRFTLAMLASQGRDIVLSEKRIEGYRTFCNKIWNASRFILMNIGPAFKERPLEKGELERFDKWILYRCNEAIRSIRTALSEYRFNDAAQAIYSFWWHEFCDWYIELTKQRLYSSAPGSGGSSETARQVLFRILRKSIKLLHPFMPFITEEIWEKIRGESEGLVIVSRWPEPDGNFDFPAESDGAVVFQQIVYWIRNIRGEMNIPPDRKAPVVFKTGDREIASLIRDEEAQIKALAKVESISLDPGYAPADTDASAVMAGVEIYVPLRDLIDMDKERTRIDKEIEKTGADLDRVEKKLSDKNFTGRAPEEVVERERSRAAEFRDILSKLEATRKKLR